MKSTSKTLKSLCSLVLYTVHISTQVLAGTQFSSHVTVNTPTRSFSHGVGDPLSINEKRNNQYQSKKSFSRNLRSGWQSSLPQMQGRGYSRERPTIPFTEEEVPRATINQIPWQYNSFMEVSIPVLPPSPYKVDSPDPESLWPEGLYLPPISPPRFGTNFGRRTDTGEVTSEPEPLDPYLLEGTDAIAAVEKAYLHGHLYFHDIPHIESLLANQQLRINNKLQPHRLGSIRHTWPFNRP
ncbi:uncharacterized protein LOC113523550 isoform X2 [Galleria mellonella]|uniref:Uncharacterized protein LOC113523550 isoform X2 n=1 Tax=Galleria mellonella TaxID=7137 RepID=A0A6J3BS46_GALME|nr:uncharacterized protein LOC113523550 isoform X2 [Galleria mellonella]